ncbi:hypothetical protein M0657_010116 [Pyricularia oryzae]|nr:hypothetical protein M0657_010116 [Pyricularia oryzae]
MHSISHRLHLRARIPPLPFVPSVILGILLMGTYGLVTANPERCHWRAIAFTVDAYLYILLAASNIATMYLIDACPERIGANLVVIPVTRDLVSFGISNGTVGYIANVDTANLSGVYAAVIVIFGLTGCVMFWTGKSARRFCAPWAMKMMLL